MRAGDDVGTVRSLEALHGAFVAGVASPESEVERAIGAHHEWGGGLQAYRAFDADGARTQAGNAQRRLESGQATPPLLGVPVSVKDLYGVEGFRTYAGSPKALPARWSREGWLVRRLRAQGAVVVGKTHTVEFAYGALGINPHWGTPRNPWDEKEHRIPGGSSSGAGVSLMEGSARVALGSDTGGSIRIPASMTGTVGLRTTTGRWPTDGVVPLSSTLDVVGALTGSVRDAAYLFGAVDPEWDDPEALLRYLVESGTEAGFRLAVPQAGIWGACDPGIAHVLEEGIRALEDAGWRRTQVGGGLVDEAEDVYLRQGLAGAEGRAFLENELPEWLELLHPLVGTRIHAAPGIESETYRRAREVREQLRGRVGSLFEGADLLALPSHTFTPPPVKELEDLERYATANAAALRPTCSASVLGLPAITLPVGRDPAGMPVGLQLVAPEGEDEVLLAGALEAEHVMGVTT